jgi:sulfite reductase (NADPH) flavoprotein alpha-component
LYGEELEAYHADGVLTHLRLAFSRDQKEKVYTQHKIQEDAALLHDLIVKDEGSFYLCGPTWPVPDVSNALLGSFSQSMSKEAAKEYLEKIKNDERYILEVY